MPRTPQHPLSPASLYPLLRLFLPAHPQGRRIADLRLRLEAVLWLASTDLPWTALPAHFGRHETVARWFRRHAHAGTWHRVLHALHDAPASDPIQALRLPLLRACRRAVPLLGTGFVLLIRRLGLHAALPGPLALLPDPWILRLLRRLPLPVSVFDPRTGGRDTPVYLNALTRLLRFHTSRPRLKRRLRLAWC